MTRPQLMGAMKVTLEAMEKFKIVLDNKASFPEKQQYTIQFAFDAMASLGRWILAEEQALLEREKGKK